MIVKPVPMQMVVTGGLQSQLKFANVLSNSIEDTQARDSRLR